MTPEQLRFVQELYETHHNAMRYIAFRIVQDQEAAADVVSQTFLTVLLKLDQVMACDDPAKWLFHALKNLAIDEYRRSKRHATLPLDALQDLPSETELLSFQALLPEGLSEEDREILTLRIDLGLDYAQIAVRLDSTPEACRMRYSRARKRCAAMMEAP